MGYIVINIDNSEVYMSNMLLVKNLHMATLHRGKLTDRNALMYFIILLVIIFTIDKYIPQNKIYSTK